MTEDEWLTERNPSKLLEDLHGKTSDRKLRLLATAFNTCLSQWSAQSALIRDIFGNPFRPIALDPRWRSADVVGLARGIYDERAFDRMPLLADALMDAECDDEQVIGHCRSEGPHIRGCSVVDLVLGKE
jgi:hypothetical protein